MRVWELLLLAAALAVGTETFLTRYSFGGDQISISCDNHEVPEPWRSEVCPAYFKAYLRTLYCPYLTEKYPSVRAKMLQIFEHETMSFKLVPLEKGDEEDYGAQCAYTYPRWINWDTIRLRPLAFEKACIGGLRSTVFHEMTHLGWMLGSEDEVSQIEFHCFKY